MVSATNIAHGICLTNMADGTGAINMAHGVADPGMAYITEAERGEILRARLPVAGRRMFPHR